jgi:hypothetical protein
MVPTIGLDPARGEMRTPTSLGCDVTFYGGADDAKAAWSAAREVYAIVRNAMPEAFVSIDRYAAKHGDRGQTPVVGWRVSAHVTADDVAAFPFGPTHRAAIVRLRGIVAEAQAAQGWTR